MAAENPCCGRAGVARPWFQGRIGPDGPVDPDGHTRFRGVATMNAIAKHLAEGIDVRVSSRVVALAPTAAASRGVLRGEGFASADTVARFLADAELQESARGQVVWVDEAGLLSRDLDEPLHPETRRPLSLLLRCDRRR